MSHITDAVNWKKGNGNDLPLCRKKELLRLPFGFHEKAGGSLVVSIRKNPREFQQQIYTLSAILISAAYHLPPKSSIRSSWVPFYPMVAFLTIVSSMEKLLANIFLLAAVLQTQNIVQRHVTTSTIILTFFFYAKKEVLQLCLCYTIVLCKVFSKWANSMFQGFIWFLMYAS